MLPDPCTAKNCERRFLLAEQNINFHGSQFRNIVDFIEHYLTTSALSSFAPKKQFTG